jgi:hypothetical protein
MRLKDSGGWRRSASPWWMMEHPFELDAPRREDYRFA